MGGGRGQCRRRKGQGRPAGGTGLHRRVAPPATTVVDRLPPVVAASPSPLCQASSRSHAYTSAARVPCSSPRDGVGASTRCRPPLFFSLPYPSFGSMDLGQYRRWRCWEEGEGGVRGRAGGDDCDRRPPPSLAASFCLTLSQTIPSPPLGCRMVAAAATAAWTWWRGSRQGDSLSGEVASRAAPRGGRRESIF